MPSRDNDASIVMHWKSDSVEMINNDKKNVVKRKELFQSLLSRY